MVTKYNLTVELEPRPVYIPDREYEETKRIYASQGLLGKIHINEIGRALRGHDESCNVFRNGLIDVHYRDGMDGTARDMVEEMRLTTSGFDEAGQKAVELGEFLVDSLEMHDPSSQVLSWEQYNEFPICPNMELNTPCGRQSVHLHTPGGGIVQFWRPNKENQWYDWDVLKDYLDRAFFREVSLTLELIDLPKWRFLKRARIEAKRKRLSKISGLAHQIRFDPMGVDRIDFA